MNQHFTIVIPSYNCENWVKKNLNSAINQEYENYEILYIDDASTDNTYSKAHEYLKNSGINYRIARNRTNKRALHNLVHAIDNAIEDTIIVALDGDDWLANKNVLKKLDKVYSSGDVWITAGSYIDNVLLETTKPNIPEGFWEDIRNSKWTLSHLRTFKKSLFKKIRKEDLLDFDGQYYKFTWDRVIMYPMVEMAGKENFKPINEVLYVYNRKNPISVDRVHREEQLRIEREVRQKPFYKKI